MKWLIGFGLSALVNTFLIGAFASPLGQLPHGEVIITDVTNGTRVGTTEAEAQAVLRREFEELWLMRRRGPDREWFRTAREARVLIERRREFYNKQRPTAC